MGSELEKITKVRLPFDMRSEDPSKNYGIHGLDVWFILKGPKGAVQFAVSLPVYLPHVELERRTWSYEPRIIGIDVGYHSPVPRYDDQPSMECELLPGGKCYYDGSSLAADRWVQVIFSIRGEHPEPTLWRMLEQKYKEEFT